MTGVTVMDTGPCTVIVVVPETPAKDAVTAAEPIERAEAIPLALIAATPVLDDFHVTSDVILWVVLSDNVPVAVNCRVAPTAMAGFAGVTATEVTVAVVRVVDPEMPVNVALMVVLPTVAAVVIPAALIAATAASEDAQVTRPVRS